MVLAFQEVITPVRVELAGAQHLEPTQPPAVKEVTVTTHLVVAPLESEEVEALVGEQVEPYPTVLQLLVMPEDLTVVQVVTLEHSLVAAVKGHRRGHLVEHRSVQCNLLVAGAVVDKAITIMPAILIL